MPVTLVYPFALLLALLLSLPSHAAAPDTAYNRGVSAYLAQDYGAARKHWAKAVDEGETAAFNNLGFLYYVGWGGLVDWDRAAALWKTAAERGHWEAQGHLAEAYEEGKGVPRDLTQAYAWYRNSLVNTPPPENDDDQTLLTRTNRALSRVTGKMSVKQLGEAELLARAYLKRFPPKRDTD